MVKFVDRGLNGYVLISDGRVHLFDGMSRKCKNDDAGMSSDYVFGALTVEVLSVIRTQDGCEVFCDLGSSCVKRQLKITIPSFLKALYSKGGYRMALTRDFVVDGKAYTQNLFVFTEGSNCIKVVDEIGR